MTVGLLWVAAQKLVGAEWESAKTTGLRPV